MGRPKPAQCFGSAFFLSGETAANRRRSGKETGRGRKGVRNPTDLLSEEGQRYGQMGTHLLDLGVWDRLPGPESTAPIAQTKKEIIRVI
jgi:hypothetical protein